MNTKLVLFIALLFQSFSSFSKDNLSLECVFDRNTVDSIPIHNGRTKLRESFSIDVTTGAVTDGGMAYLVAMTPNAKITATETKFSAVGDGELTKDLRLNLGSYSIDRVTGSYKATVVLAMKTILDSVRISQIEESGTCQPAKKKF